MIQHSLNEKKKMSFNRETRMAPVVYSTDTQSSKTKGPLPGFPLAPGSPTWGELNELSKQGKNLIQQDYIDYLNADLQGDSVAKDAAVASMNEKLQALAATVSATKNYSVRFYLLNNASRIRAASRPADVGVDEYGRTEIIVAQQSRKTIANCIRTSGTTSNLTWYSGLAMGAFARDCELPAHVFKTAITQ